MDDLFFVCMHVGTNNGLRFVSKSGEREPCQREGLHRIWDGGGEGSDMALIFGWERTGNPGKTDEHT